MAKRAKRERRKPGTGYTTQAPNKTWIARFPKRGGKYHTRRGFSTRTLAENWLDSLVIQRAGKVDVGSGQQRLDFWVDRWIERSAKERSWKAKMLADVHYKLGYVKPFLGDYVLADVLPDQVDLMIDELARDLAENTIRQIRNYLYQVFESAVKRRYITFNPVIKPERRKRAKQKPPERLSAAQAALLLRAAEPSFYCLAWWLILILGLRAGEACGLRWGDVDLDQATVTVAQEVTDVRGVATKDQPKGDKVRTLPLSRALIPLFRLHKAAYTSRAAQGLQKGYWRENGLVFPGRGGRPMNPTSLRHQLTRLTDACKLPPVTTHMLRHTAGKFYTDLGCPQNVTGAILGHATGITGHYAPPDAETMRPWVEQVYRTLVEETEHRAQVSI
jgi:integrase